MGLIVKNIVNQLLIILVATLVIVGNGYTAEERLTSKKNVQVSQDRDTTTGFMQEINEKRIYKGEPRTGKAIYDYRCKGCHERNTQGAPMPDDKYDWAQRLKKGIGTLKKHSLEGYNNYLMPPKGGCRNCTEQEVYAAVLYMIKRSGNSIPTIIESQ